MTMGNKSSRGSEKEFGTKVMTYLQRTWEMIVADKWTRSDLSDVTTEYSSRYSTCSCSQCQKDDGFSSACDSDLFDTISTMAPNSEHIKQDKLHFIEETISKEKQRPPIYNPEDYALSLKKWGRRASNGGGAQASLYAGAAAGDADGSRSTGHINFRDYKNPMLMSAGSEMTLRQFGTVSELLAKLKTDLRLAYPSFIQEFVSEPLDGVVLLLDLLRAVQLSQSTNPQAFPGSSHTTGKVPPAIQRRALLDELSCLQCLHSCCSRYSEATRRLTTSSAGLFTLAICIMSNVNKSRILALQILTKICDDSSGGHSAVSEALSTLRLRFGEPVRFRFLVGMLNSTGGSGDLLAYGMKFLNTFLDTAPSLQKRLYVQAELEQAGFDIVNIKRNVSPNSDSAERLFDELLKWEKNNIDVELLTKRLESAENENDTLRDKVILLERKIQVLQEEKGVLASLEQCLKNQCTKLKHEVESFKSENSMQEYSSRKKPFSKTDDEGISSSERSSSPEDQKTFDVYKTDEEETTIEEVMEDFRNIIHDAESADNKQLEEAQVAAKIRIRAMDDREIVPSKLHPQPPRKTRSLIRLFAPAEDFEYGNKELFFENETNFSSDDDSDSLLSASRYNLKNYQMRSDDNVVKVAIRSEPRTHRKSKSLDRIDDGLESMVDIVLTNQPETYGKRSVSQVFITPPKEFRGGEKQRMFLPAAAARDRRDAPFYFPRVQEKYAGSQAFVLKRGHANAGLYSGRAPPPPEAAKRADFQPAVVASVCKGAGKVTDSPSGLY